MQKVVIINLNGFAYHLEESAYAALGAYLAGAEAQLRDNPDRTEIVRDLEQAIADKFGRYVGEHKNVVTDADMATILDEMGPVHDESPAAEGNTASTASTPDDADIAGAKGAAGNSGDGGSTTKRLYLMLDTGVIGGVCSGMAAFSGKDVTLIRVVFVLAALLEVAFLHTPFVAIAYLVLMVVVPVADTSEERAAARGVPFSAQQLIDEAKRNFASIGERDWKHTRREWRQQRRWERKYQRQMRRAWAWPPPTVGSYGSQVAAGVMTPVLTLAQSAVFWLMAYAVLSMASTGGVHGWHLPGDVPLWLGIVAIVLVYHALVWPLHIARQASHWALGGPAHARYAVFEGLMSTILAVAVVWSAYHYSAEIRGWLHHLPEAWQNIVASFRS